MKQKVTRFLRNQYPVVVILSTVLILFKVNFTLGTWLTGWDNLHPEFDFGLNFKRSFFAVWQEYQGLGLLGGMGHASDLVRQLFLWVFSVIFPLSFLRYFYHFLMLFAGSLGVYFLLRNFILSGLEVRKKTAAGLVGAIFYLFNLGTLQMFFVPFEAYSAHFAALPWLFLAALAYLGRASRRNLGFLFLVNVLALAQGYVATFFLVYAAALGLVLLFFLNSRQKIKRVLIIVFLTFSVNAFWLLPNLYFAAVSSQVNVGAKINQMATTDNFLKNQKYGDLANTALLKGFWFDNVEMNADGQADYQMGAWVDYVKKPRVLAIGYLLFGLSLAGMFFAFWKKIKKACFFTPVFIFSFIVLANDTPLFSAIADLFYKLPLFAQVFRFPFTKFALLTAFSLSLFYALAYLFLDSLIKKVFLKKLILLVFIFLPILYLSPVFAGQLFYSKERAQIPSEYFQTFEFFGNQDPNTRIANFPQNSFWGWTFYRWNYSGSGLLWYGVSQPILDRAFDVWSRGNENYYWEISHAVYSQNLNLLEKVLEKYQIAWLLVDGNVITPGVNKSLYFDELEEMIDSSEKIALSQTFGEIKIYKVDLQTPVSDFVFLAEDLPVVGPKYQWNNYDLAYLENGNYLNYTPETTNSKPILYPFRSLFTGRAQADLEFEIKEGENSFVFKKTVGGGLAGYSLQIPKIDKEELVWINPDDLDEILVLSPEVSFDGGSVEVLVPKVGGYLGADLNPAKDLDLENSQNCNQFSQGRVSNERLVDGEGEFLRLSAIDAANCSASFWLPNLSHYFAYLVSARTRGVSGKSFLFWLENLNIKKADIETYLPANQNWGSYYFIQPPMEEDGLGYSLHFDNISIGERETVNDLGKVEVNLIPYRFLTGLKLVDPGVLKKTPQLRGLSGVSHPNPSLYQIKGLRVGGDKSSTLVLSQAYNNGWQAYLIGSKWGFINNQWLGWLTPLFGQRVGEHVLVNNWENGWLFEREINEGETVALLFLPQYWQSLGFLLLGGLLFWFFFPIFKNRL